MSSDKTIVLKEYSEKKYKLSEEFIDYLQSEKFNPRNSENIIIKYKNKQKYIKNNGAFFGIIKNHSNEERVLLIPKFTEDDLKMDDFNDIQAPFLLYMLTYFQDENEFLADTNHIIDIKHGKLFLEVVARIFLNYLRDLIKKGLFKSYVKKEENLRFLKGKLLFKEHIKRNTVDKSKIYCRYDELTYNNLENQIILYALNILLRKIKNPKLKSELRKYEFMLRELINLKVINYVDIKKIKYNRLNQNYKPIHKLSEYIIRTKNHHSFKKDVGPGFNFIVDMNKMYEYFISMIFKKLEKDCGIEVNVQDNINNIVKKGRPFTQKPDIVIEKNGKKVILDIKYKSHIPPADFYQILSYVLAYNTDKGVLLYESINDGKEDFSKIRLHENNKDTEIKYKSLNLFEIMNEYTDSDKKKFENFEEKITEKIKGIIEGLFNGLKCKSD